MLTDVLVKSSVLIAFCYPPAVPAGVGTAEDIAKHELL